MCRSNWLMSLSAPMSLATRSSGAVADAMAVSWNWGGGGGGWDGGIVDAGVSNANGHTLPCYELRQRWMPALPLSWMLEEDSTDCAQWHHRGKYDAFPWQRISQTRHFQSPITLFQTPLDTVTTLFTHMKKKKREAASSWNTLPVLYLNNLAHAKLLQLTCLCYTCHFPPYLFPQQATSREQSLDLRMFCPAFCVCSWIKQ